MSGAKATELLKQIETFPDAECESLLYDWPLWARPNQLPPETDWLVWLIKTGRGWGKNRSAGETINRWVREGTYKRVHLVARTAGDARDTMVEGESGILAISPPWFRPLYEPSKRRLTWPNGATATLFSAEEPDALRGPQCDCWWADELAAWRYLQETWDQLRLGARLGNRVRGIITTTPRPLKLLREIMKKPTTHVTHGHTFENSANLSPVFLSEVKDRYEGTRLGRQELAGEMLEDNPDALWKRSWIERDKVFKLPDGVTLIRIVVALDPSTTSTGDEAGVVAAGKGSDGEFYVLEDATLQGSPTEWGKAAVTLYHKYKADLLVYESNQGGEMVRLTLNVVDKSIIPKGIHASRGKITRAEPIAALAEQGRIHHVGSFPDLEDELCQWTAGKADSPNRLDAMVWAMTELHSGSRKPKTFDMSWWDSKNRYNLKPPRWRNSCISRHQFWSIKSGALDEDGDGEDNALTVKVSFEMSKSSRIAVSSVVVSDVSGVDVPEYVVREAKRENADGKLESVTILKSSASAAAHSTIVDRQDWVSDIAWTFDATKFGDRADRATRAAQSCKQGSVLIPHADEGAPWTEDLERDLEYWPDVPSLEIVSTMAAGVIYLQPKLAEGWRQRARPE